MPPGIPFQGGVLASDVIHLLAELDGGILFLTRDWHISYANNSARLIARLSKDDVKNKTYWQIFPETLGTELERKYLAAMEQRIADRFDFHFDRFSLWLDISIIPIETGIALVYRDVTKRVLDVADRLTLIQEAGQVFDVTSDAIFYLDREYKFTYLNRRARELFAPEGDVTGALIWDRFPGMQDPASAYLECFKRSMEQKLPCDFEEHYGEPLNKWFCIESRPARNGIVVFFRDNTKAHDQVEQMRAERQAAETQRAELEAIYRTAPIGLALFDPVEFRYLRMNEKHAEFFDLAPDEAIGQPVTHASPLIGVLELLQEVAAGESVRNRMIQGELASSPGVRRCWMVNYSPICDAHGQIQAISAASLEITRQKRTEEALILSEKIAAVGKLAASVSHEINNPLESITNLLYIIATDPGLPESLLGYIQMAQGELSRAAQIATQTLRFHRQSMRPSSVDPARLVNDVIAVYQGRLANTGISVQPRYGTRTPCQCFENDIRQVLNNLIGNAIDAINGGGHDGGRLWVRTHNAVRYVGCAGEAEERGVRITIADNGHGMAPAIKARVFEAFYTTKDLTGTGLGLWICSEIVQRHGGRLSLRSSVHPQHHGTVFSLFLPLSLRVEEPAG